MAEVWGDKSREFSSNFLQPSIFSHLQHLDTTSAFIETSSDKFMAELRSFQNLILAKSQVKVRRLFLITSYFKYWMKLKSEKKHFIPAMPARRAAKDGLHNQ